MPGTLLRTGGAPEAPARPQLEPFALWPVVGVAAAAFVLLMVVAARYGYHRDELYFLEASRHLAWSYVDQPPLSVAVVWLSRHLFGDSLCGLRLLPSVAFAVTVVLTGLVTRELGGRRFAQVFAALLLAISPFLIAAHLAGPTIYDLVGWALTIWLVLRILRTGDQRLWLLAGLVVGVSLLDKNTILFLVIGLAVGLLVARQWRVLASPWVLAAALIAVAIWTPNLIWQAQHGWPTVEMSGSLRRGHSGAGKTAFFVLVQLFLPGIWALPVWTAGLWALWRETRWRAYRAFAVCYAVLFVLVGVLIGDRPYYIGPTYVVLFAAGAIVTEGVVSGARRFYSERPPRRRLLWRSRRAALVFVLVVFVLLLPTSLPVLPARVMATVPLQKANYDLGEEVGWPEMTRQVARAYVSLPVAERKTTAIITGNYGEAGAVDRYGPALGLPPAFSGHNNYWWWGPPPTDTTTVVFVGSWGPSYLSPYFSSVVPAGTIHNSQGVQNDENGLGVWICRGPTMPWPALWRELRHYD